MSDNKKLGRKRINADFTLKSTMNFDVTDTLNTDILKCVGFFFSM